VLEGGGTIKAMRVPRGDRISNSRIKPKGDIANEAVAGGAAGLVYIRCVALPTIYLICLIN
jgi:aspartyl-tRNA synthetase